MMKGLDRLRHILFFIFLASIAMSLFLYSVYGEGFDINEIHQFASSLGVWLPLSFIILYAGISVFLPTTPMMALAGILFGFKYGLLFTTIGGFISAFITFYISRYLGRDFVDKLLHKKFLSKIEDYDRRIARHGFTTVMVLRMLPIMPFNVLNLLMGISRVRAQDYALGTIIGLAPSNALTVYFGGLIFAFVANRYIAGLLGLLFLIFAITITYKKFRTI
jgi:uncharacterized membrane protein YdjX (TVP38/TMEM64 family)